MAAYNAQDHVAIGKMYTDDAVRIDPQGKEIKGADNTAEPARWKAQAARVTIYGIFLN